MSVVLQISDTHFGTELPPVVVALRQFVREQRIDLLLWSGDITQRARPAQFAAARAFLDSLAPPAHLVIPGNHDIPLFDVPARVLWPYAGFCQAFGERLEGEFENDDLAVIALNTTRPWRHKNGELSAAQITRAAVWLQARRPEQLRVVVVHQPVCVQTRSDRKNLLRGHEQAIQAWSQAGADLVLGGHIHLPYVCPLAPNDSPPGATWTVQAGTAVSWRVRRGTSNSVNMIRYDAGARPRRCLVERWDFNAARGRFECALSVALALRRAH